MPDIDSEALRSQRRRRKRIGRIKNAVVFGIAGWVVLSMTLTAFLFAKLISLEQKMDRLIKSSSVIEENEHNFNRNPADSETFLQETGGKELTRTWEAVKPPASGVEEADNLAGEADVHKVYLTFEDGPSEYTEEILDILAEYNVKATFFVTGSEDEKAAEMYRRIVEEGHSLGMNSYSNKYSIIYQSVEAFTDDYQKLRNYLYDLTGVECNYYRFPGGSNNPISNVPMDYFIHYLNEQGTVYYDWNVSVQDTESVYTPEEIVKSFMLGVLKYKTSVILLHDSADESATVEVLGPLIEALQKINAEILPIDEDTSVIQYVKADRVE